MLCPKESKKRSEAWRHLDIWQKQMVHRLVDQINSHTNGNAAVRPASAGQRASTAKRYRMTDQLVSRELPMPEQLKVIYDELRRDKQFAHLKKSSNFVGGDGPHPQPRAVLIGEAPGANEDRIGRPFVGRSGNFLDSMMMDAGLKRAECFVTNVVKWRPPDNRTPSREEVEASVPYLRRELVTVMPRGGLVILLGSVPLDVVDQDRRVTKVHGKAFPRGIWTFMPMYHPSYVMQNRAPRDTYKADWAEVERMLVK